jgi:hypothetical protein
MKKILKIALVVFTTTLVGLSVASTLNTEWKEFVTCLSSDVLAPKVANFVVRVTPSLKTATIQEKQKAAADKVAGLSTLLSVGLKVGLANISDIDWSTTNGSQICQLLTKAIPSAITDLLPSDFRALVPAVIEGACFKGLTIAAGTCTLPGSKLNENEYLASEFSKCVASKIVASQKVKTKLGDKVYLRTILEGAFTSGIYKTVISNLAKLQKATLSLGTISTGVYNDYLKSFVTSLNLEATMVSSIQDSLDSIVYLYGKDCFTNAKASTTEALKNGLIAKQTAVKSALDIKVGNTESERAAMDAKPADSKVETDIVAVVKDDEFVD